MLALEKARFQAPRMLLAWKTMMVGKLELHPAVTKMAPKYCTPGIAVQSSKQRPMMQMTELKYSTGDRSWVLSLTQLSMYMRSIAMR